MHIVLLIQARCNSSKIPYKIIREITPNKSMIEHVITRCQKSKLVNQIIINTTSNYCDEGLINLIQEKYVLNNHLGIYRGSELNVLDRCYQAANLARADVLVLVMANSPLFDPNVLDIVLKFFLENQYDYVSISDNKHFPVGFNFEIIKRSVLEKVHNEATDPYDLEHVTSYIRAHSELFHQYIYNLVDPGLPNFNYSNYPNINFKKLTLDVKTNGDWEYIKRLLTTLYDANPDYGLTDVLKFLNENSEIISYRSDRQPIETENPLYYGRGQKLAVSAKKIIPNLGQDISKNPATILPDIYPTYYSRAGDIEITTIDGIKLKDFSTMANGSCILGYRDPDIDSAVHDSINRGNLTSLSSPNEVKLAKMLLELHPWATMAKFTKPNLKLFQLLLK